MVQLRSAAKPNLFALVARSKFPEHHFFNFNISSSVFVNISISSLIFKKVSRPVLYCMSWGADNTARSKGRFLICIGLILSYNFFRLIYLFTIIRKSDKTYSTSLDTSILSSDKLTLELRNTSIHSVRVNGPDGQPGPKNSGSKPFSFKRSNTNWRNLDQVPTKVTP